MAAATRHHDLAPGSERRLRRHASPARRAAGPGRGFVIADGSWFGAPDADGALASDDAYSTQQSDMWLTDWPSLVLCMLDGTADTASRFMRAGQYLRPLVLLPSREGRRQTLDRVFAALRTYRLHGVLRPGPSPTSAARVQKVNDVERSWNGVRG